MEEVVVEPGASSASAAADSDDSLSQPSSIALVESIDEALVPDIIAGTTIVADLSLAPTLILYIRCFAFRD